MAKMHKHPLRFDSNSFKECLFQFIDGVELESSLLLSLACLQTQMFCLKASPIGRIKHKQAKILIKILVVLENPISSSTMVMRVILRTILDMNVRTQMILRILIGCFEGTQASIAKVREGEREGQLKLVKQNQQSSSIAYTICEMPIYICNKPHPN